MKVKKLKSKNKKKVPLFIRLGVWVLAILSLLFSVMLSAFFYVTGAVSPKENGSEYKLKIQSGQTLAQIAQELEENGIIRSQKALYYAARLNFYDKSNQFNLKTGICLVNSSMSLKEVYFCIQDAKPEYIVVSIPEGLTVKKISKILENSGLCTQQDFLEKVSSPKLLKKYDIPAASFEGYLFPDTYYFNADIDVTALVCQMADTFFDKINQIDSLKSLSPEELFEKVTLASIIEREYRVKDEAPLIAGVFSNRLKIGMGLESCATVEYVITEILGKPHPDRIFYADLEIDNPYNTYKYAGLPPGPISCPGFVSLSAAASPKSSDYYYFVLNDVEAGTHTFSRTLGEHNKAANLLYTKR